MTEARAGAETEGPSAEPTPAPAPPPLARMGVAVLALVGLLIATYMLLHRLGIVGRLICGPEGACEIVQSSKWATFLSLPVPLIGVLGYLALLLVAVLGLQPPWARDRRVSVVLVVLSGIAVAFTAYLTAVEAWLIHAWCRWCLGSAAVIVLILACALVDLVRAGRGEEAW